MTLSGPSLLCLWTSGLAAGLGVAKAMTVLVVEYEAPGIFTRVFLAWAPLFDVSAALVLLLLAWWLR